MKTLFAFLLFFIVALSLNAQKVVSSSGKSYSNNNGYLRFTTGELNVKTYLGSNAHLSQGFHQNLIPQTVTCNLSISVNVVNSTCDSADGSATATIAGGSPPYSYQWTNGDLVSTADSLKSGLYFVTVTDANNCTVSAVATLSDAGAPAITVSSVSDVSCNGGSDASINISVSGGITPYSYLWSTGAVTEDIANLFSGSFEVEVSDTSGCKSTMSVIVSEPSALSVSFNTFDAACGIADGNMEAVPAGGTSPYTYLWSTSATTSQISNLASQIYSVSVTDNNGCSIISQNAVSEIGGPSLIEDSVIPSNCSGLGSIYVSISGGASPYAYNWSDSSTNENLIGVSAGNYGLSVTDNNGCNGVLSANIPFNPPVTDPICLITVDTGTGTNKIVWQKTYGMGISSYQIYKETTMAGVYQLAGIVPFDNLSVFTDSVANPLIRSWRYKISAIDSCGNESGQGPEHKTMHLTVNQGLGNTINLIWDYYQGFTYSTYYIWRYKKQTGWTLIDSLPGNLTSWTDYNPPTPHGLRYFIEIIHLYGCTATKSVENHNSSRSNKTYPIAPLPPALTASTNVTDATQGNCDGEATVTASGGISPYTYLWNDTASTTAANATGLCPGDYSVTITDSEGDTLIVNVNIGVLIGINGMSENASIRIYPNPVKNEMTLAITIPSAEKVKVVIMNTMGQETRLLNSKFEKGKNIFTFDIVELSTGVYYLQMIIGENQPAYLRFVKAQ